MSGAEPSSGSQRGISRRALVAGAASLYGVALTAPLPTKGQQQTMANSPSYFAYIGCRTTRERNARGDGISVYRVDGSGAWERTQLVGNLLNPSFLAFDRNKRFLLTVHGDSSEISAFRIDAKTGALTQINQQSTQGLNPVHLTIDPTNRFVIVANHLTGKDFVSNVAVLPLKDDGSLGPVCDMVPLTGKTGPHRVEQPFAKPHQVQYDPSNRFIVVPDKGCDLVRVFRLDAQGKLETLGTVAAREGSGPRHVSFHPTLPYAYVVNELDSTIAAYHFDPASGALKPFQIVSSLPDSFTANSRASEIEVSPDGRFVHATNRGDDSIGSFAIDQATGRLSPVGWESSQGKTPRFFTHGPGGHTLLVANEESDSIVTFAVDQGHLRKTGAEVKTGSPTCIITL